MVPCLSAPECTSALFACSSEYLGIGLFLQALYKEKLRREEEARQRALQELLEGGQGGRSCAADSAARGLGLGS